MSSNPIVSWSKSNISQTIEVLLYPSNCQIVYLEFLKNISDIINPEENICAYTYIRNEYMQQGFIINDTKAPVQLLETKDLPENQDNQILIASLKSLCQHEECDFDIMNNVKICKLCSEKIDIQEDNQQIFQSKVIQSESKSLNAEDISEQLKSKFRDFTIEENKNEININSNKDIKEKINDLIQQELSQILPALSKKVEGLIQKESKKQQDKPVHHNVSCNGCSMNPIIGVRYKCAVNENFNYCENCEETKEHSYPFFKFNKPEMEQINIEGAKLEKQNKEEENKQKEKQFFKTLCKGSQSTGLIISFFNINNLSQLFCHCDQEVKLMEFIQKYLNDKEISIEIKEKIDKFFAQYQITESQKEELIQFVDNYLSEYISNEDIKINMKMIFANLILNKQHKYFIQNQNQDQVLIKKLDKELSEQEDYKSNHDDQDHESKIIKYEIYQQEDQKSNLDDQDHEAKINNQEIEQQEDFKQNFDEYDHEVAMHKYELDQYENQENYEDEEDEENPESQDYQAKMNKEYFEEYQEIQQQKDQNKQDDENQFQVIKQNVRELLEKDEQEKSEQYKNAIEDSYEIVDIKKEIQLMESLIFDEDKLNSLIQNNNSNEKKFK